MTINPNIVRIEADICRLLRQASDAAKKTDAPVTVGQVFKVGDQITDLLSSELNKLREAYAKDLKERIDEKLAEQREALEAATSERDALRAMREDDTTYIHRLTNQLANSRARVHSLETSREFDKGEISRLRSLIKDARETLQKGY